ncbi:Uncharacterised protein [Legionella beliardensis]|uniref:Oligosaccharide repeat unit polymerase n=1 Tax=Legionella beliardensis TaxID=91822 RepID=A0A378HZJ0_9GAMM|nr:hypothetical protein [Legionella beliardensis]STX27706.1 Uncharacterised protein [Legionella beliardensis]
MIAAMVNAVTRINNNYNPFLFKNFHLYFLMILTVFFIPQEIYGFFTHGSSTNFLLFSLTCLAMGSFLTSYYLLKRIRWDNLHTKKWINLDHFSCVMTGLYAFIILYTALTAKDIALFAALRGVEVGKLAYIREEFLRTRVGHEIWLRYGYNIMVFAVIPLITTRLFVLKHKLRYPYLLFFIFTLSLTLQKSLSQNAFIPLIILAFNIKNYRMLIGMVCGLISTILLISFLAFGGVHEIKSAHTKSQPIEQTTEIIIKSEKAKINFLKYYVMWIPYETGLVWLDFKEKVLNGKNVNFESFHFLGPLITGKPYFPLENLVFRYQFHSPKDFTGSANVTYFIDAYAKFGAPGVIVASILIAFLTVLVSIHGSLVVKSMFYLSLFYMALNQLSGVLFSGGVGLLIFVMLFSYDKKMPYSAANSITDLDRKMQLAPC